MILVTLGTQDKSFDRLLKAIDKAIDNKKIKDKVVVQAGHTKYESKNMEIFDFIPMEEFDNLMKQCDILITHGGVGSIISGIRNGKKVIAAARLAKYKEHNNDHQLQIINKFSKDGFILPLEDFDNIDKVIKKAKTFKPNPYTNDNSKLINIVTDYIDNTECKHELPKYILYTLITISIFVISGFLILGMIKIFM